ncbi:uncharacterized protein RCO7_15050 [Rhynchosporium graminicola]|uniref:Uncharacterized protein n=1 Tax=Rhynchosporium graminicola TaxID=2792576 RepID=A0A1E1LI00_9HELO|nr:uncharacterized protein RCO7_15050 [Rhynchosporium commune]
MVKALANQQNQSLYYYNVFIRPQYRTAMFPLFVHNGPSPNYGQLLSSKFRNGNAKIEVRSKKLRSEDRKKETQVFAWDNLTSHSSP